MKSAILQLMLTLILVSVSLGQEKSAPVKTYRGLVPSDHAEAIFKDERVQKLLILAKDSFGVTCTVPAFDKVTATITQKGPVPVPDFTSFLYDFPVACRGDSKMNIKAEFAPPLGTPLNITVAVTLQSTR